MRKRIFIGSSTEAIAQAKRVANLIKKVGVEPVLWTKVFKVGELTLEGIEKLVKPENKDERLSGAIFLATPDDFTVIRKENARVTRANVIFEYGYLMGALTRHKVALCRYADVELPHKLPSDIKNMTYVDMGAFDRNNLNKPLDKEAQKKLREWVSNLSSFAIGPEIERFRAEMIRIESKDQLHTKALEELLGDSMKECPYIANVSRNQYFTYLKLAVEQSDSFQGVVCQPISKWFTKNRDDLSYLRTLRDQRMTLKQRIFIIDDKDEKTMKRNLKKGSDAIRQYWENTGHDVQTFWILRSKFKKMKLKIADDFSLYDNQLLIKYNVKERIVTFDVQGDKHNYADEQKLFTNHLQHQVDLEAVEPFTRVNPE